MSEGLSRYAYVQGNPETLADPDGHCWPVCTMIIGALVGAAIGAGVSIATQAASGHSINWGEVGTQAAVGAVSGAIAGLAGPEAGPLGGLAAHALIGAASGMAGQLVNNAMEHKPLGDGVLMAGLIGGATVGLGEGVGGPLLSKLLGKAAGEAAGAAEDAERGVAREAGGEVEDAAGEDVGSSCAASGLSFAPGTPVATPKGEKPIASLKIGDQVVAYDPKAGKTTTQTVQHVWINHDTDLIDLTLRTSDGAAVRPPEDLRKARAALVGEVYGRAPPAGTSDAAAARDEVVHTTARHPFLTTAGWVPAGQLTIGVRVVREDGVPATVVGVRVVPGAAAMWNLTVSQAHTYAVGSGEFVVHNCGGGGEGSEGAAGEHGETVDLYRAVGVREFKSVMETGRFEPGGNSLLARQFAFTEKEALAYARTDLSKVAILRATIRKEALRAFDFSRDIDPTIFKNGVITVQPGEQTEIFDHALLSIRQVV